MRPVSHKTGSLTRNSALIATLFVLGLPSVLFSQQPVLVVVGTESTVSTDRVDLGSIASVSEAPGADRLRKISLGYAPNIGATRQIPCSHMDLSIRAAGFTEAEVSLKCTQPAIVRRAGQTVTAEMVREAVTTSLSRNFSEQQVEAKFARIDVPENFSVPTGTVELVPDWSGIRNIFAPFSLPVRVRIDGKTYRTLAVNAEIEAFAEVLVAARDLAANSVLSEQDVRTEKVRLTRPISSYLFGTDRLAGTMTTREIRAGEAITSDQVASVAVVKPGDPVYIEAHSEGLKLIVIGEAKAAGRIGDRIAVKNTQSGTVLQAVVVDRGRVRINL